MRARTIPVFAAAPITNPTNSPAVESQYAMRMSAICTLSNGTNQIGTFVIQVSNAIPPGGDSTFPPFVPPAASWQPVAQVNANSSGTFLLGPVEICSRWVRVVYTPTSGAGGQIDGQAHLLGWS